jgi:hypothetical protein
MPIKLIFQSVDGRQDVPPAAQLEDHQAGLVPLIGDCVRAGVDVWRVQDRIFVFADDETRVFIRIGTDASTARIS